MSALPSKMAPASLGKRRNLFIAIAAIFVLVVILYSQPIVDTERFKNIIPHQGSSSNSDKGSDESGGDSSGSGNAIDEELQVDHGTEPEKQGSSGSDDSKDAGKDAGKDDGKDESKDGNKDENKDAGKDDSKDDSKDDGKDAAKDDGKDDGKDTGKDHGKGDGKDILKPKPAPKPSSIWDFFGGSSGKVSKFHYLVPASSPNRNLCYNLVSSAVNRFPPPLLAGYNATGEWDASVTHLAKLRTIQYYLDHLDKSEDDDLVLIVDGYDLIMQLPPLVMIERYFEMRNKADERLAKRFGISVDEARSRGLRQTLFWGPDKICWPIEWNEPRCWAVPHSSLANDAFGPGTGNGDMDKADPRWMNSGTVIGPVDDLRKMLHATMEEIEATYDAGYSFSESDQYYLANVWGRQEYFRSLKVANGQAVPGSDGKVIPKKLREDQKTELHISIDYESALFQTKAGYERWFGQMKFSGSGFKATMDKDLFHQGDDFRPYDIQMPTNVASELTKLYESVPDAHPDVEARDWLATVDLGVNYITKHIYGLWHCTGGKEFIDQEYTKLWWYPFARSLTKAAIKASQEREVISSQLIDGRKWVPKTVYPPASELKDQFGGAWSDYDGGRWVNFDDMCSRHYDILFGGEESYKPPL